MTYLIIFLSLLALSIIFTMMTIAHMAAEADRREDEIMGRRKDDA